MLDEDDRLPTTGEGAGIPLTRFEKSRIDFSKRSILHARWCKAAAYKFEEDDWLSYYDHRLTVGEHVEVYARSTADPSRGATMRHAPWPFR